MNNYYPRIIDEEIEEYLDDMGAILIVGPKWCGKTTSAKQHSNSMLKLESNRKEYYYNVAEFNPDKLLDGQKPRLIDEWQVIPIIWDIVRNSVDDLQTMGNYILTGSTVVNEEEIEHSGAGRIHRMLMMPMSLYESKESNGLISLKDLFNNPDLNIDGITSQLSFQELIFAICRGGWPVITTKNRRKSKLRVAKSYVDVICSSDVSNVDGIKRDSSVAKEVLKSYARNISTLASDKTILKDITANFKSIDQRTLSSYMDAFKKLFLIYDVEAWTPNIRSASAMRKTHKREFIDPSIAVASLNLSPEKLFNDFETLGFIFETLCIRDLRVYSTSLDGMVRYYNDKYGVEADCVLELDNGEYALIEFKLGTKEIDKGAKNLLKLKSIIMNKKEKGETHIPEPSFLAVITASDFAYTRKDGVKVIPIACLKD